MYGFMKLFNSTLKQLNIEFLGTKVRIDMSLYNPNHALRLPGNSKIGGKKMELFTGTPGFHISNEDAEVIQLLEGE